MADFFEKPEEKAEEVIEPEKIKLGDKEYTQDELNELVGLGTFAKDVETRQNTKLDRIYPEYTKTTQRVKELEAELEAERKAKVNNRPVEDLSPEEIRQRALAEAEGLGLVHTGNLNNFLNEFIAGYELRKDVDSLAKGLEEKGIKTSGLAILEYMKEQDIKRPDRAVQEMYDEQLKAWEKSQEDKLKQPGLVTDSTSTAGFKVPADVRVDKSNLKQLVVEALNG